MVWLLHWLAVLQQDFTSGDLQTITIPDLKSDSVTEKKSTIDMIYLSLQQSLVSYLFSCVGKHFCFLHPFSLLTPHFARNNIAFETTHFLQFLSLLKDSTLTSLVQTWPNLLICWWGWCRMYDLLQSRDCCIILAVALNGEEQNAKINK